MVSSSHEAMHRIFQEDPGMFARTFRTLDLPFPDPAAVSVMSPDLTEIKPLERRVDTLLRIDSHDDDSWLLIVEAQGKKDPDKPMNWAYYAAHLYAKYRLPPVLLITCQDKATATWAKGPFHAGPRQWRTMSLNPIVLGPHNVPVVTDPAAAAGDIPLATLSAITHGKDGRADAILKALADALSKHPDEGTARLFAEITELGLGDSQGAKIWRHLMSVDLSFFRSETSQKLRAEGQAKGRAEGRAEDILIVLEDRGIEITPQARERIAECDDLEMLRGWLKRSLTATTADDLFDHPAEGPSA